MPDGVEAHSLSSLNFLAANPPQYPVNPTEQRQEPLILYIARVPGSRGKVMPTLALFQCHFFPVSSNANSNLLPDVILTPSKPQLKNVTAEDVNNSFYYIHLEQPGESPLPPPPSRDADTPKSGSSIDSGRTVPDQNRIPRKPLPPGTKVISPGSAAATNPESNGEVATPPVQPGQSGYHGRQGQQPPPQQGNQGEAWNQGRHEQQNDRSQHRERYLYTRHLRVPSAEPPRQTTRDILPPRPQSAESLRWTGDGKRFYSIEDPPDLPASPKLARRPLGPRAPPNHRVSASDNGLRPSQAPPAQPDHEPPVSPSAPPPLPSRPPSGSRSASRSPSPVRFHNSTTVPYTLHLIRRDLATGHQVNVGSITSYRLEPSLDDSYEYSTFDTAGLGSQDRRKTSAPQPEIDITIQTSGYAKFRGMPSRKSVEAAKLSVLGGSGLGGSDVSLAPPVSSSAGDDIGSIRSGQLANGFFHRQLIMAYTKTWTAGIRERLSMIGTDDRDKQLLQEQLQQQYHHQQQQQQQQPWRLGHGRNGSNVSAVSHDSSVQSFDDLVDIGSGHVITKPGHGLRPKGYMFTSPWEGTCCFRTGHGGRSLKLSHSMSDCGTMSSPHLSDRGTTSIVSELRFNLPGRDLFSSKTKDRDAPDGGPSRRQELAGQFGRLIRGVKNGDEDEYDDDGEPWDATGLGREKAGGGNRGKRVKLGKLIIYPEGLKMLDLVVAANMGVWWGAWERSF